MEQKRNLQTVLSQNKRTLKSIPEASVRKDFNSNDIKYIIKHTHTKVNTRVSSL